MHVHKQIVIRLVVFEIVRYTYQWLLLLALRLCVIDIVVFCITLICTITYVLINLCTSLAQEKRVGNTAPFFARISHKDGVPYGKFTALRRVPSAPVMGPNYTGRNDGNRQFSRSVP